MLDDWSDLAFWKFFRLDRPRFRELCDLLRPDIETPFSNSAEIQVACAVGYMRSNSHQEIIGRLVGVSQASVSRYVQRVTTAIAARSDHFIKFPTTVEVCSLFVALSRATTSPQFQALDRNQILFGEAGMDAVGAIDCTHIQARLMSFPSSPPN
jgi:hypothetical protein